MEFMFCFLCFIMMAFKIYCPESIQAGIWNLFWKFSHKEKQTTIYYLSINSVLNLSLVFADPRNGVFHDSLQDHSMTQASLLLRLKCDVCDIRHLWNTSRWTTRLWKQEPLPSFRNPNIGMCTYYIKAVNDLRCLLFEILCCTSIFCFHGNYIQSGLPPGSVYRTMVLYTEPSLFCSVIGSVI